MQRSTIRAAGVGVLLAVFVGCNISWDGLDILDQTPDAFDQEALNFLVVGDWGRGGWLWQDEVAEQMGRTAEQIDSHFVISTGDNFYEDGVTSVTDRHWQSSFERVYTAPSLQRPWYAVLGNHDYQGNVQAQIDYTNRSDRWTMPARYYAVDYTLNDTTNALFVFLDTENLREDEETEVARQLAWLDSTLTYSHADWRIVVGHRQLFAVRAGHGEDQGLQRLLQPIFARTGVAAYLCGHVHSLQHLKPQDDPVHYLISGAGSLAYKLEEPPPAYALFAGAAPGFLAVSLTPTAMYIRFIDFEGKIGYAAEIPPRQPLARPVPTLESADKPELASRAATSDLSAVSINTLLLMTITPTYHPDPTGHEILHTVPRTAPRACCLPADASAPSRRIADTSLLPHRYGP